MGNTQSIQVGVKFGAINKSSPIDNKILGIYSFLSSPIGVNQ